MARGIENLKVRPDTASKHLNLSPPAADADILSSSHLLQETIPTTTW